jgi:AAA domain
MAVALIGAHRTGKTSLARAYAERRGVPFVETSVSAIWKELGYDPSVTYDFETRLTVQEEILKRVDAVYGNWAGLDFITDRSPLDMAAYTLADAIGDRVPASCQQRLAKYVNDCFDVTNRRFGMVFLIQPGIALVHEEGKAAINVGYIEHLNSLILGLSVDERLTCHHFYMPRAVLDFEDRLQALVASVERARSRVAEHYAEARKLGTVLVH